MTVIVGLKHNGNIYMGADSAGVAGFNLTIRADEKIFTINRGEKFIMGFTSSYRMGQLLRYMLNPKEKNPKDDDYKYMVTSFVETVRSCLKTGGYSNVNNNEESGGIFLVGFNGRLYKISSDYQVEESLDSFNATGCGQNFALGSLMSTTHIKDPKKRIRKSLEIAEHFSAGVRRPFKILKL